MTIYDLQDRITDFQRMLNAAQIKCRDTWCDEKGRKFDENVLEPLIDECNYLLQLMEELK